MKIKEAIICLDDKFTGTTSQIIEYLGLAPNVRGQITTYANVGRPFRGHKVEMVGHIIYRHHYKVYEGAREIYEGTGKEIEEKFYISPGGAYQAAINDRLVAGRYRIKDIGIIGDAEMKGA